MAADRLEHVEAGGVVTMAPNACADHEPAGPAEAVQAQGSSYTCPTGVKAEARSPVEAVHAHGMCYGRSGGRAAGGGRRAICANCLHPADWHKTDGEVGRECDAAIAVTCSDGPVGCPCERCIVRGTPCSVDGCGKDAVHFRMDHSDQIAYDMCSEHYYKAEPYCDAYYELTRSRRTPPDTACCVDGCDAGAVGYRFGAGHARHDMCVEHLMAAQPYSSTYYKLTGGRPFPGGTPCIVDGCGAEAVQYVSAHKAGTGGTERMAVAVCRVHYGESARAAMAAVSALFGGVYFGVHHGEPARATLGGKGGAAA